MIETGSPTRFSWWVVHMSYDFKFGDKVKPVDLCQYTLAIDSEVYLQSISNMKIINAKSLIALSQFPYFPTETVRLIIKDNKPSEANKALEYFLSQNTIIVRKRVVQHD